MTPRPAPGDAELIATLQARLDAQSALIRDQTALLAHSQKIFNRASEAARIGVWECSLPDESLVWTDVVYDIFDLPRGAPLDRAEIIKCYPEDSVRELTKRRSRAIAERTGFSLDTEIVTVKGNRRWMRITATVESVDGVPCRIFGMKQDITAEKIMADRNRYLAEFDIMTGLANRSMFQSRLSELDASPAIKPFGALLLIDLDGFKCVNDSLGHAAGDEGLRHAAQCLRDACGGAELVARIGGDEFAVLTRADLALADVLGAARAIVETMGLPIHHLGRVFRIGASVGIGLAEDCTSSELFMMADAALYAAKNAGRSTYRLHQPGNNRRHKDSSAAA